MSRSKTKFLLVFSLTLFGAVIGVAQNRNTAELVGTVSDASGAVVPQAKVTITNLGTHTSVQTDTNDAGNYAVPFLQPGLYSITIQREGFETVRQGSIALEVGQTARFNVTLRVGRTESTVTVEATALLLGTDSTERGTNLSREMVGNLPLVGRNAAQLAVLAPGTSTAQSNDPRGDPGRWSVNGSRSFSVAATVNGATVNLPNSVNFDAHQPPLAAVAEFSVISNNFSSEYGTGTSVLNMVTKSGTNRFHGSAFEFLQNNRLNARNFFAKQNPPLRRNQFGGTLGGPIVRDKLFFFGSYENTLTPNSPIVIRTVPSQAVKGGDFSAYSAPVKDPITGQPFAGNIIPADRIDPVAKAVQSYLPEPNQPGSVNNYYRAAPRRPSRPIYDVKIDYVVSDSNQLTGSAHFYDRMTRYTGSYPGDVCFGTEACGEEPVRDQSYQITDRWTIGPRLVNEFRTSFMREYFELTSPSYGKDYPQKLGIRNVPGHYFPAFSIGGAVPVSMGPGNHYGGTQNVYSVGDNLIWMRGAHIVKIGGQFTKTQVNSMTNWSSGNFNFSGLFSGIGYADFLLGLPDRYSLSASPNALGARRTSAAAFVQDDYRISRNVTLNLGLRYQFEGGFSEAHDRLSNFNPNLANPATGTLGAIEFVSSGRRTLQQNHPRLFAPRAGLAWSVRDGLVVRAAYGRFYILTNAQNQFNSSPPGYAIAESLQTTDQRTPVFQLSAGPPPYSYPDPSARTGSILNGKGIRYWPYEEPQPYVHQWHFSIQRQLDANSMVEAAYVGTKGSNLGFPRDLNQVPPDRLGPGNAQSRRPYPQYQDIHTWFQDGYSNYNSLQLQFRRKMSRGLTVLTNYTLSKALDNSTFELTTWGGMQYQVTSNPGLNYGLAQSDQTHRLVAAYVYEIPAGKGRAALNRGGLINAVLGGWQTSGTFTANTGAPFTLLVGGANLSGSLGGNLYPDRLADGALPRGQRSVGRWFDTSAFVNPAPYRFGTAGRNILRGPGYWVCDMAAMKDFHVPLSEQTRLQLRGDFFNLFNHTNFGMPNSSTGSAAFGTITKAFSPRQIQLGLQFLF